MIGSWRALCYKADESADEKKKLTLVKRLKSEIKQDI
jgi:hypothetical protein